MAITQARVPEACPFRAKLPSDDPGTVRHTCLLAQGISKAKDPELCAVREDECAACCRQRPPTAADPNPMVASKLYGTLLRIKQLNGVEGCTAAQAEALLPFAGNHLLIIQTLPGQKPRILTQVKRAYTGPCRHLGRQTGERNCPTCKGNVRQKTFACHHPRHEETTIQGCQGCADYAPGEGRHAVEKWAIGMTTAPRAKPTLKRTLASFRAAGWDQTIHLFAEPGDLPALDSRSAPIRLVQRDAEPLGAWSNFLLALTELHLREPEADAYLMLQDDVRFARGLRAYLEEKLWPGTKTGVVSLHTASHMARNSGTGFFQADVGWGAWGAQAFVFSNAAARAFLADGNVMNHRLLGVLDGKANVDSVVGDWCRRAQWEFWLHAPSVTEHTGSASTLWPESTLKGRRKSADFPGDSRSIAELLEAHRASKGAEAPNAIVLLSDRTIEERAGPALPRAAVAQPVAKKPAADRIQPPALIVNGSIDTSVVVTCHPGYLHCLPAALESIDAQSMPFHQRILVLDRVTKSQFQGREGWEIVRVKAGNPNRARNQGLEKVTCEAVIFWDADNVMPREYLEKVARLPAQFPDDVAFFYPHIIYRNEAGEELRRLTAPAYDYWLMRERTFMDTSSLWKTVAVRTVGGWCETQHGLDDYELALRLTRNGWRAQRSEAWTSITEHPRRRTHANNLHDSLWTAWTVGIVTLWGGRTPIMKELLQWYADADLPPHASVYWLDNTGSVKQRAKLEKAAIALAPRMKSISILSAGANYPLAPGENYQTWARHQHVANLYNSVIPRIREDLVLFVEDDNLPNADSVRKLHACLRPGGNVAAAGAVYASRNSPAHACGSTDIKLWRAPLLRDLPREPVRAGMMGGGCAIYWNSAVQKAVPFRCLFKPGEGLIGWDGHLGRVLTKHGYELRMHGGIRIPHHCPEVRRWLQENPAEAAHH